MIVPLMLYTLAVGALVAVAALGLEGAFRLAGRPTRWIWAGALLLALALVATAPFRVAPVAAPMTVQVTAPLATPAAPPPSPSFLDLLAGSLQSALHAATAVPLARLGAAVAHLSGGAWSVALLAGWGALSGLALLAFAWTALRYRAIRRRAPLASLHGTEVRVAGSLGPAVVGLFRHEIVVPSWLLGAGAEEQRLILAHEAEHRRARDPLLLAGGWLAIVLVPWHPAVWWMASRLRLATEMDCDARVLRRGVEPLAYGSLLITVAGRCAGIRVGVSALADSRSHLERRLTAMIPETRKFALARGGALAALALAALLAACEASIPTAADVEKMDVASLEKSARAARMGGMDNVQYFVDGKQVTSEEAHAVAPEQIVSVHVMKALQADTSKASVSRVKILTKDAPEAVRVAVSAEDSLVRRITSGTLNGSTGAVGQGEVLFQTRAAGGAAAGEEVRKIVTIRSDAPGAEPLFIIDGVESNAAALRALGPDRIESINVTKGATATEKYGAKGANGVILITTKK